MIDLCNNGEYMNKIKLLNLIISALMLVLAVGCDEEDGEGELQSVAFLSVSMNDFNRKSIYRQDEGIGDQWRDCEKIVSVYDEYFPESGDDSLQFDDKGRLRHYMNFDGVPAGKEISVYSENEEQSELNKEELLERCEDILESSVDNPEKYEFLEENSILMESVGSIYYPCYCFYENAISQDVSDNVLIRLDEYGNILELQIDYSGLDGVDVGAYEEYFQGSIEGFIAEYEEKYDIASYEINRYLKGLDNKICAFYSVTFHETDGAAFAEGVVFSQELE